MRPPLATRAGHLRATFFLLAVTAACGEFRTDRFTDPIDTSNEIQQDALDLYTSCPTALQLAQEQDLDGLVVGVPSYWTLVEESGHADLWLIQDGNLPPGLSIDHLTGALSGVPDEPGEWTFTIRVTAHDDPVGTCYDLDDATYTAKVTQQCSDDTDCSALVSEAFREAGGRAYCAEPGRCLVSDGCPNDPRQRVSFVLGGDAPPLAGSDGLITGGEVIRHARIQGQKNPDDLRRQVLILFQEPDAAVLRLDYTLPDNWPLPLQEGDPVALALVTSPAGGEALRVEGPGGAAHMVQGFWVPGGVQESLPLPELQPLLPLACPNYGDACGIQTPAAANFGWRRTNWTLTPGDITWFPDLSLPESDEAALLVRLGWSMFRGEITPTPACAWSPPATISMLLLPVDDCPGAVVKTESPQDVVAGEALAEPPVFEVSGWKSFSPAPNGAISDAAWTIVDDPFGGDFAQLEALPQLLPDPAGLGSHRMLAGAVGEYRVGLTVEDRTNRPSCVTDTIRFRVFPDPEIALRAELVWLPYAMGGDSIEVHMKPSGSAAWDDPARVCGPASALPEFFEGAQCAAADLPGGRPALATLRNLAPTKTYGFALRAPETNNAPLSHVPGDGQQLILHLFCNGEAHEFSLPEGFKLSPGELVEVVRVAPGCVLEALL